jgi:hypothetical protein
MGPRQTPPPQGLTPETASEEFKEELRKLFVGEDAPFPHRLCRHANGLDYKNVDLSLPILERLLILLTQQRDQTLDALHDYFTKLTEAKVRRGCLNRDGEQMSKIADQERLIWLLMRLIKSMPLPPPAECVATGETQDATRQAIGGVPGSGLLDC